MTIIIIIIIIPVVIEILLSLVSLALRSRLVHCRADRLHYQLDIVIVICCQIGVFV